ncbi:NAD(P)-dependent oxidoreductase [Pigmentiphaga soli]|uniref:NAD(P)-dependent oxidoreductase n=1 Tax=Pigmentiphaga soli TaxID=1007095 RepID=A0ABP8H8X8_9BURK
MEIGFIGLGNMGAAMASNLLKAGHRVTVWNRSPARADALVAAGARRAATPAEAAAGELVVTMLADDAAVEGVVFGADGLLAAAGPALHVSMSTIGVALADRLAQAHAEAGRGFVCAPVFGRPAAAGADDALARCEPTFAAMGQKVFRIGAKPSAANVVKLCGNFMIMATIETLAEAMSLCRKSGVPEAGLLDVLTGTLFSAPVYQVYGEILLERRFRPAGFAAPLGLKDMRLVGEAADGAGAAMPLLELVKAHLLDTLEHEGPDVDWSAIATAVDRLSAPAAR